MYGIFLGPEVRSLEVVLLLVRLSSTCLLWHSLRRTKPSM